MCGTRSSRGCVALLMAVALSATAQEKASSVPADTQAATSTTYERAVALNMAAPEYPEGAVRKGRHGDVVLVITIDSQGSVSEVEVEASSGYEDLDVAAVKAARAWRFIPAIQAGQAVASRVRVPVEFISQKPKVKPQGSTAMATYTPPSALEITGPQYPKTAAWQGAGGTVVLRVSVGRDGTVSQIQIESSSGNATLDAAALWSARSWRFNPAARGVETVPAEVRVPVAFVIPAQYALDRVTGRPRDAWFQQRREGNMPRPPADAAGKLPGFIEDAYPIGVSSIEAGKQMLERHGYREPDAVPDAVLEYTLRDEEGMSVWNVLLPGRFPAALLRRRLVGDGEHGWYVSSLLCEGASVQCDALSAHLQATAPSQEPMPVPPTLPPLPRP